MATFDVNLTEDEGYGLPWPSGRVGVLRRRVDFTDTDNALAQNKIMSLFKLPADCIIITAGAKVITADTDIATASYLGLYTETSAGVITAVDADGLAEDLIFSSTGYKQPDVNAAYGPAGASAFKPLTANSVVTFTNIDTDTVNEAVVDFYVVAMDVSLPIGTTVGGTGSYTT